ncbi:MAG: hypothetical protein JNK72_10120 [Myxococcales bacterium]|nr:hypothetical protein [Myxococcales bacterium]
MMNTLPPRLSTLFQDTQARYAAQWSTFDRELEQLKGGLDALGAAHEADLCEAFIAQVEDAPRPAPRLPVIGAQFVAGINDFIARWSAPAAVASTAQEPPAEAPLGAPAERGDGAELQDPLIKVDHEATAAPRAPRGDAVQPDLGAPGAGPEPRAPRPANTAHQVSALVRRIEGLAWELFDAAQRQHLVSELVCRVRHLKKRGDADPEGQLDGALATLAEVCTRFALKPPAGLRASDPDLDWGALAEKHRLDRTSHAAPGPLKAKLVIPYALGASVTSESAEDPCGLPSTPRLLLRTAKAPLVIVGGIVKPDKLQRLRATYASVEWVATECGSGHHAIDGLVRRIREGRVGAVIVLHELMAHSRFDPLVKACRNHREMPMICAGKGGRAAMRNALSELELCLEKSALPSD